MANMQYVRENRIRTEMTEKKTSARKKVLAIGIPLAIVLTIYAPVLFIIWFGAVTLAYFVAGGSSPVKESGAAGEDYTLAVLKSLPDSYIIFNQLDIPDERSRTGFRELDFIVCGPNGIFVVESKNHNGEISGDENDQDWVIHKVGRRGTEYSNTIKNPVKQVRQQIRVLKDYLNSKNLNEWIHGIVALSSDNSLDRICSRSIPVVCSTDITNTIASTTGRKLDRNFGKVVAALAELRGRGQL